MVEILSTPKQRQLIGYFRKLLCLSEDIYKEILWTWGVDTSKELSIQEAEVLLNQLKKQAIGLGKYTPKAKYKAQAWKYNNLSERTNDMASPAQLRKIEAMWFKVSYQQTDGTREQSLNNFCERITGKQRLNFLTKKDTSKLICALETMHTNKREESICN